MPELKKYTVLLLRPDYMAATFGHDTFCAYASGATPVEALADARAAAAECDDADPEDYYCLLCTNGHIIDYQDGRGGVIPDLQFTK